ncbi:MAG: translation initiation factor IF-2, partial [Lachnospira sp.]
RNGQGGFQNKDNQGGFRKNSDGQDFGGQRRNDRQSQSPKDDFLFETKPDSRRPSSKKNDNRKNDRKRDNDSKENLKFANSKLEKKAPAKQEKKEEETIKQLILPDTLTIKELADKMKVQPSAIVKKLFLQGKIVTINEEIDYDAAEEIALEFNCICDHEEKIDVIAELLKEDEEPEENLIPRPPVVCVMGHVDHGKTSLLDAIRETHVTAKESGGITQKIGAYTVDVNGQSITFLDTPGHEAFTAMRMRGAQSTDIAILVVAADDGVMPQTIEAINHAKAAGVEIIVAVNKIDKPNANVEKVKQELTEYELIAADWGGSTTFVPVSAHTKEGIDELLEMILLTAEVNELKANPNRKARGIVIEAELDKGRGPVATILVQKGTLKVGDAVAAGACFGKIRAMIDDKGRRVREATPSMPVEILGLNDVPNAGEIIMAMDNEKEARNVADTFIAEGKKKLLDDTKHKVSLDALFEQIQAGNMKELDLIIKADVQGSVEAVKQSLVKLSNEEVIVKVIHGGVGNINESDVVLASASNAIIIGFNVKPDNQARIVADREKVDLRLYSVIYNAIEDVEAALKGMLEPVYEEKVIGTAEIRQIFKASGVGNIAGAIVTEGRVTRDSTVRISRDGEKIFEGPIATLKHFKDEVKEVKAGTECGMVFEGFGDIQEGDIVEAHIMVEVPR